MQQPPSSRHVIALPDPALVVLIGAAGAGKSTLAARLFGDGSAAVLSSDTFRGLVGGSDANQRVTRTAFAILHRELERRLAARRTTVVDATNVTAGARGSLLRRAAAHGIPAIAIVLDLDARLVLGRNAARAGRVVPTEAVLRQLAATARALMPGALDREGFAAIHVLRNAADLDLVAVTRWLPRAAGEPEGAAER